MESALSRMQASFDGEDLEVTIESKVAAVTFSLINNHGFIDGNKRAGIAVMLLLLRLFKIYSG